MSEDAPTYDVLVVEPLDAEGEHIDFAQLPFLLLEDGTSANAFKLFAHYVRERWINRSNPDASLRHAAEVLGFSTMTAQRARAELVERGWLRVEPSPAKGSPRRQRFTLLYRWNENNSAYEARRANVPKPSPDQLKVPPVVGQCITGGTLTPAQCTTGDTLGGAPIKDRARSGESTGERLPEIPPVSPQGGKREGTSYGSDDPASMAAALARDSRRSYRLAAKTPEPPLDPDRPGPGRDLVVAFNEAVGPALAARTEHQARIDRICADQLLKVGGSIDEALQWIAWCRAEPRYRPKPGRGITEYERTRGVFLDDRAHGQNGHRVLDHPDLTTEWVAARSMRPGDEF